MKTKLAFAAAAALLACVPCQAHDLYAPRPEAQIYLGIPLGAGSAKSMPALGLALQGRHFPLARLDTPRMSLVPLGGVELKWAVAGAVAVGAALAVGRKDRDREQYYEAQRQQQREDCQRVC
jgi:hypothetical protein